MSTKEELTFVKGLGSVTLQVTPRGYKKQTSRTILRHMRITIKIIRMVLWHPKYMGASSSKLKEETVMDIIEFKNCIKIPEVAYNGDQDVFSQRLRKILL